MKKWIRYVLIGLFLILFSFLLDLHISRGYFLLNFNTSIIDNQLKPSKDYFSYTIEKTNDSWLFRIKNNSPLYHYINTFGYGQKGYFKTGRGIFSDANNPIITFGPQVEFKNFSPWGCGTGIGKVYIFPFEEFIYETDDLFEIIDFNLYNSCNYLSDIEDFTPHENVTIQFSVSINGFPADKECQVFSNPVTIPFKEWMDRCKKIELDDEIQ